MLTAERLRQALSYDPKTGIFTRREPRRGFLAGAGKRQSGGYIQIMVDGRGYYAHRLAWIYMTGAWPKEQIDHINRVCADNRWANLREASPLQNNGNRKRQQGNKSGYKGVWLDKHRNRWVAEVKMHGRKQYQGHFKDPVRAHAAYLAAAKRVFGEFASAGICE